ncbi:methyltransferase type 11 [Sediminicola sp. YIK13]|uniref:class I SAM-dependent methyltransferase n=1 Tax=Sediminicola sp. YIK13 TaxID=1453352 RepID=UPI000721A239|nr:class I SAM-dependent methyltransferase [Sediminicola sp. YIK13]ALM09139.1 methyltransferase type 11 [Sediminicola sp. YIK13]
MKNVTVFDNNVEAYDNWYSLYEKAYLSELEAIKEQMAKLPENIRGIEVGVGTGRFAQPLGIKEGIEPSLEMAKKAIKKGIEIIPGVAEKLPYGDLQFDFVLFVTICHLENFKNAVAECYRVLKPKGSIIIGFLDKEQGIAQQYELKRQRSTFFKHAKYYTVDQVKKILKDKRFKNLEYNQTLFGDLESITTIQMPKQGYGEGSFVVIKADKK